MGLGQSRPEPDLDAEKPNSKPGPRNLGKDPDCSCCPKHFPHPKLEDMPCGHKKGGRNLVVCIDGTANQFGKKNTNVVELYNLIMKDTADNQHTWYNSGIGTYARPHWASWKYRKQVVFHTVDLAIAWDFDKVILAVYKWLADNYEDGDCIFLFGFSRGAFQVRVLSAMIKKVGLLYKGNEKHIPFAYELYADPNTDLPEDENTESTMFERLKQMLGLASKPIPGEEAISMAERFKRTFSRSDVKIHFLGVWDTVSSVGTVRAKRMLPGTVDGMDSACYFRHALALDERRVKFLPEYVWGGTSLPLIGAPESSTAAAREGSDTVTLPPHTLEVWFAGTHSDIGGGNKKNIGMDRSRPPLRWMASEAEIFGLRLKPFSRELLASEQIEFQESLKGFWHVFEVLPLRRLTLARTHGARAHTFRPHLWSARKIHPGQKIHSSIVLGNAPNYVPKARPPPHTPRDLSRRATTDADSDGKQELNTIVGDTEVDDLQGRPLKNALEGEHRQTRWFFHIRRPTSPSDRIFWDRLRADGLANSTGLLELDLFGYARILVKRVLDGRESATIDLNEIMVKYPDAGPQAVFNEMIDGLSLSDKSGLEDKVRLLSTTMAILRPQWTKIMLQSQPRFKDFLVDVSENGSSDHKKVVDDLISYIFEDLSKKSKCQATEDWLRQCVVGCAFGTQAIYNQICGSIRSWDPASGADDQARLLSASVNILKGLRQTIKLQKWREIHDHLSSLLKSGTQDHREAATRFLELFTSEEVNCLLVLEGHTKTVRGMAISPDGKQIVTGSDDSDIRIWGGNPWGEVETLLRGHTFERGYGVTSVQVSSDGKRVFSAGGDTTIRIWDVKTGAQVGEPLLGHTDVVNSVGVSPDGKHIVSGSDDRTVRIWDAETREAVGEPLRGHTDEIWYVAISSDGKRIVSGSKDKTLRIWDVESGVQQGDPVRGHTDSVTSVAILPDGKWVVSASLDGTIRIWDAEKREQAGEIQARSSHVFAIAISPDSKHIISGSSDHTIRIWDLRTGEQVGEPLRGHTDTVWSVATSPDGKRIVSGSKDSTVRIWSTEGIF